MSEIKDSEKKFIEFVRNDIDALYQGIKENYMDLYNAIKKIHTSIGLSIFIKTLYFSRFFSIHLNSKEIYEGLIRKGTTNDISTLSLILSSSNMPTNTVLMFAIS